MTWINVGVTFGDRFASFGVPFYDLWDHGIALQADPDQAEQWFLEFLAKRKPELAGGWLLGMHCDLSAGCWRFLYMHRSFERVPPGRCPPAIDLFDKETVTPDVIGKTG